MSTFETSNTQLTGRESRCVAVFDDDYTPDGDDEIIAEETAKIASGEWAPYGLILQQKCDLGEWHATDSIWGCVVATGSESELLNLARWYFGDGVTGVAELV